MDFKHINNYDNNSDKYKTPKSINSLCKRISQGIVESPFRNLPNFSTPPSRFTKILNPFEHHLIERLHLPTFSPNVFCQSSTSSSTPKTEQKFKWTIEDISSLKPADIDETTVSQHVVTEDPHIESIVQQKISTFFSEKEIVPSPMNVKIDNAPLVKDCRSLEETPEKVSTVKITREGATQTILTLPPILPKELEDALKPYFNYTQNQQQSNENDVSMKNTSLYKELFEFGVNEQESVHSSDDIQSLLSSPAVSTGNLGISPILFSPSTRGFGSPPELKDCTLSPITKTSPKKLSRSSACRLDFSENMSMDVSMIVPDVENQQMSSGNCTEADEHCLSMNKNDTISEINTNWSMEYKQVSLDSPVSSTSPDKMDISNANTPRSKLFTGKGQRKRLSESFKNEDVGNDENNVSLQSEDAYIKNRNKIFRNDTTDVGYYTQDAGDFSNHVFASTPSKRNAISDF